MFNIVILLSGRHGRGSNMAALAAACARGDVPGAEIAAVIGTHADSPALANAASLGLQTRVAQGRGEEYERGLIALLDELDPNLICLAGYMRKIPAAMIARFPQSIINMHPALLPSFGGQGMYGEHVHAAVIAAGCKVSGCTVHFVDDGFDTGAIISQSCVTVLDSDTPATLGARVLTAEHAAYWQAVRDIAAGRVSVAGRVVRIAAPPSSAR